MGRAEDEAAPVGAPPAPAGRGDAFWALSDRERRRAVALDVLARLDDARLVAAHRGFLTLNGVEFGPQQMPFSTATPPETHVEDALGAAGLCDVCALGAMFVSQVDMGDRLTLGELCGRFDSWADHFTASAEDITGYLGRTFAERQVRLVECAYERGGGRFGNPDDCECDGEYDHEGEVLHAAECEGVQPDFVAARDWRPDLTGPQDRMRAIMRAIADDPDCEFHPERAGKVVSP